MLVTRYIATIQNHQKDLGDVVVAKTEIPVGAKIAPEQLALAPIPNGSAPDGVYRTLDEVAGRVAVIPIGVKEPITNNKLAPEGEGAGLGVLIPEGYRAMTVKVDDVVGVSGFVQPGSFVDIVAVVTPTQNTQGPISKIVLQNIKVLASGPKIDSPQNQREPHSVSAVTVLVTPEQAEKLVLATSEGRLQLVMRNFSDQEDTRTAGANKTTLLSGEPANITPDPKSEKPVETAKPVNPRPRVRRTNLVAERVDKAALPPQPITKKSIELIEGTKRRDVDIP
jgi:pilus assembly protein CpaB